MRALALLFVAILTTLASAACAVDRRSPPLAAARTTTRTDVCILGEVNRPGWYVLRGPTTLESLIVAAGGFTPLAFRASVRLQRTAVDGRRVAARVDVSAIEEGEAEDVAVAPGDCVIVPERTF